MFAASASQALQSGLSLPAALHTAAHVNTSSRLRIALLRATKAVGAGTPLAESFPPDGFRLSAELLGAMDVGERRGCIADELWAYAVQTDPQTTSLLSVILGRSIHARRFAQALARLLGQHTLTPLLAADAAQLVAAKESRFGREMKAVVEQLEGGASLGEAIEYRRKYFDPLFVACVSASESRDQLQAVLNMLSK